MPRAIRETLTERIRRLPSLTRFLEAFRLATGMPIHFVGPLGLRTLGPGICTICRYLHGHPMGLRHCNGFLQRLLESASNRPTTAVCDAGLLETAVPLRTAGQTFGYIVFGHCLPGAPDRAALNRARHLLARAGIAVDSGQIATLTQDAPVATAERMTALTHLAADAVERLVLEITQQIIHPSASISPAVERACRLVRGEFTEPLSLGGVARRLGMSAGHLSRVFHHNTGLRFVEYVARVRADHARRMLLATDRAITDIAFASGFQSLSQFNRVMRAHFGCAPRELRRRRGRNAANTDAAPGGRPDG